MDEIKHIRAWLLSQKGHWVSIAASTGLSTKTLQRIVKDDGWLPNLRTLMKLKAEMDKSVEKSVESVGEVA